MEIEKSRYYIQNLLRMEPYAFGDIRVRVDFVGAVQWKGKSLNSHEARKGHTRRCSLAPSSLCTGTREKLNWLATCLWKRCLAAEKSRRLLFPR